jgi:hypothetical protein
VKALRIALLVAGAAALAVLVERAGASAIADMMRRAGPTFVGIVALRLVYLGMRAVSLVACLPPGALAPGDAMRLRVVGESLEVLTLMGPFVAEPGKAWLLKRRGLQTAEAFGGVLGEYLLYSVLAAWMCGLSFILIPAGALPDAMRRAVAIYVAVVASVTAALVYALLTGTGPVSALLRRLRAPQRLVSPIADGEAVITRLLRTQPRRVVVAIAAQSAAHLLLALEAWLVFRAIGNPIPAASAVAFEGAAKLVDVAFFFVPGHLGAQEGVYEMVAPALGAVPAAGLTLALLRRMRGLVVAVAGLALLARWDSAPRKE